MTRNKVSGIMISTINAARGFVEPGCELSKLQAVKTGECFTCAWRLAIVRVMQTNVLLVLCNCPDDGSADQLAEAIIRNQVGACVNIGPVVTSFYRWHGVIERSNERPLLIKTTAGAYPALERLLRAEHPYDVPEVIAVPVTHGLPEYLTWVNECIEND